MRRWLSFPVKEAKTARAYTTNAIWIVISALYLVVSMGDSAQNLVQLKTQE